MRIRYTSPADLEIEGSSAELHAIRKRLLQPDLVASGVDLSAETAYDPAPYRLALGAMVVRLSKSPLVVKVAGEKLRIEGSMDDISRFASFFNCPNNADKGWHSHYEYHEGNPYVSPESIPLVISVSRDGRAA